MKRFVVHKSSNQAQKRAEIEGAIAMNMIELGVSYTKIIVNKTNGDITYEIATPMEVHGWPDAPVLREVKSLGNDGSEEALVTSSTPDNVN